MRSSTSEYSRTQTHSLACITYSHFKLQVGKLLETRKKSLQNFKDRKSASLATLASPSGTSTPNGWKLSKGVDNFVVEDIDKVRNRSNPSHVQN